jgi:hypothetical protein
MELTYIAAPYSHEDVAVQESRFQLVTKLAAQLVAEGRMVFSPITHSHPIAQVGNLPGDYDYWGRWNKRMLLSCDRLLVLMIPGWHNSKGVLAEIEIMQTAGKPVDYIGVNMIEE